MSKFNNANMCMNSTREGLLCIPDERMSTLIKKEPITAEYHVEHTPFARASGGELQYVIDAGGGESSEVEEGGDDAGIGGLPEAHATRILKQVLEAIAFLHDHNIAHLDIKPQNILLLGPYPEADVKICDFGISRVVEMGAEVREILGTPDYVAPEVLSYEPISLATDIWSIGVLAYVLLSGCSPFGSDCKQETFCNISRCNLSFPEELFGGISETALDFMRATIVAKPRDRLTARQCLEHPWLRPELPMPTSPSALFAVLVSHAPRPSSPTSDVSPLFKDPTCPAKCTENHCKCGGHESYSEGLSSPLKSPMEVMCDRGIRC
ncbi:death-associated protein kinase related-like isoform X2 [Hetaerina americana]|uniref:death-associated protein kinase related-like isoform X2 n=1 Tax=Hetaerina americana TaxID=62018 RepID=UPI003A7F2A83